MKSEESNKTGAIKTLSILRTSKILNSVLEYTLIVSSKISSFFNKNSNTKIKFNGAGVNPLKVSFFTLLKGENQIITNN